MTYQQLILKRNALERQHGYMLSRKPTCDLTDHERLIANLWHGVVSRLGEVVDDIPDSEEKGRGKTKGRFHAMTEEGLAILKKRAHKILTRNPGIHIKQLAKELFVGTNRAGVIKREWTAL